MELGATVCRPRRPCCGRCPLRAVCRAFLGGDPAAVPRPRRRAPRPHWTVGAAVTLDARGRVLVAQRPDNSMLGGLWEFPGGKVEPGETIRECIRRELIEELGLEVEVGPEIARVRHDYTHFRITLHAYACRPVRGRARPLRCAAVGWIRPADARQLAFSTADLRVLAVVLQRHAELRRWARRGTWSQPAGALRGE
ncbi:MAG: NUDIX domain-containing protein [Kiritimatiellae bacterium]|nr:NUDIX domain-containing protein [Kiritimatiellia bacterium]